MSRTKYYSRFYSSSRTSCPRFRRGRPPSRLPMLRPVPTFPPLLTNVGCPCHSILRGFSERSPSFAFFFLVKQAELQNQWAAFFFSQQQQLMPQQQSQFLPRTALPSPAGEPFPRWWRHSFGFYFITCVVLIRGFAHATSLGSGMLRARDVISICHCQKNLMQGKIAITFEHSVNL